MMLNGCGAYSSKFKSLEKDRLDRMRNTNQVVRVAVQDRARSLSLETNRRRRALELRKKLEAQKEAKRRQEILDDRKQRQNEATQKYQRLKSGTQRKTEDKVRAALYGSGKAYDSGVYSHPSNTWNNGTPSHNTPGLDDALRAVRGSPGPASKHHDLVVTYPQTQTSTTPSNYPYYQSTSHSQQSNGHIQHGNQQGLSSNHSPMNVNGRGVYYHGFTTSATSCNSSGHPAVSDGTTVKSIYEKQIEDQQRNIVEQNQKSLLEFNKAVLNEAEMSLRRSSSCSSVDSLEGQDNRKEVPVSKAYSTSLLPSTTQTNHYTYYRNGVPVSIASTITQAPYQVGFDHRSLNPSTKPVQNNEPAGSNQNWGRGEIKLEETNETDIVQDQVDINPRLLNPSSSANNRMDLVLRNHGSTKPYSTRTTVAWASPQVPVEHSEQISNAVTVPHSRPFSGKTTATVYSVEPASSYQYRADVASRYSKPEHNVETASTPLKSETTGPQLNLTPGASQTRDQVGYTQAGSTKSIIQAPKSILKKGNITAKNSAMTSQRYGNYTMSRLGGAKVMDSLELRKASSMSDIRPSKKGIRWADLEYKRSDSDDDHYGAPNEQVSTRVNKKSSDQADTSSRPTSAKVTSQNRASIAHEGRISSAGSIQRSSVARPRLAVNRQPVNSTSGKEPNLETNHVDANANKGVTSTNGNAVYGPNGMRLDRTPTDDEINWLWDKVRTCLNVRDEQGNTAPVPVAQKPPTGKQASLSSQYVDGKRIVHSASRMKPTVPSALVPQNNSTHPRRRTSSDTASSFLRRTALLQQRRQHAASLRGQNIRTSHHDEPVSSADVPSYTTSDRQNYADEVSDSLMLFQRAELLAQDDLSETEIAAAIQQPQKSIRPDMKGPSALSMEEQRLLESLDRLNERLRLTSEATSHLSRTYAPLNPKVSTVGGGFRGHRPLSSTIRTASDIGNRKPHVRTMSADRASGRTNYRY